MAAHPITLFCPSSLFVFFIVFVLFFYLPHRQHLRLREKVNSYFSRISQYALMNVPTLLLSTFRLFVRQMAF